MPGRNSPRTKDDLRQFSTVEISLVTDFYAVSDGRLLKRVEQVFPIPLTEKLRTSLHWTVKDYGISYTAAMAASLVEWFKALAADREVQEDMRKAYPHLPAFRVSFSMQKHLTWIKANN